MTAEFQSDLNDAFRHGLLPAHLGVTVMSCGDGRARMRLPFRPEHLQNLGVVQGGVTAALIDITLAWAVLSAVYPAQAPTIDLTVSYLLPITGEDVQCQGTVLRAGRSVAIARAEVTSDDGRLLAIGTGSFLVRRAGVT